MSGEENVALVVLKVPPGRRSVKDEQDAYAEVVRLVAERDRYRAALEHIHDVAVNKHVGANEACMRIAGTAREALKADDRP